MMFAGLLAAGVIAVPPPDGDWILRRMQELYPVEAIRGGVSGAVDLEYIVTPEGRVRDCTVRQFSGYSGFGAIACHVMKRQKLVPPTLDGQPITAVLSDIFMMASEDRRGVSPVFGPPPADIDLVVRDLPGTDEKQFTLSINLAVDAKGQLQQCHASLSSAPPALEDVACRMVADWGRVVTDTAGQPIPYITQLRVKFSEEEPAPSQ